MVAELLAERERNYGHYNNVACTAQQLKAVMRTSNSWGLMDNVQKESLEMVANKLARVLNGDPLYRDSWVDAIGYLTRVVETL